MNDKYIRQLDIITPEELNKRIAIIGVGGVGSWATLSLAKMGCADITVFDFDKVEDKNTPSQIYSFSDIGKYKVDALKTKIFNLTDVVIKTVNTKFVNDNFDIIICGVDSLKERRDIWKQIHNPECFVDIRMSGDLIKYFIASKYSPKSITNFEKSISDKKTPYKGSCTGRAVVYNTFMCGGFVANLVKKYILTQPVNLSGLFDITNFAFY